MAVRPRRNRPWRDGEREVEGALAVVSEDTVAGLRSARAAGCLTVGVLGIATADELHGHAGAVVASLADLSVTGWDERVMRLRLRAVACGSPSFRDGQVRP
ncbi:HAD family hydrolase [Salinactinospora qingdaonensis]|uniref:Uncharacterized protein n=1 Tax=Salinactinospora qingdaonensis TaxID=702744 RepID=A0ABP7G8C7_9ACTN